MEYRLTEDQLMLRDVIRKFVKNEVKPSVKVMEETKQFPTELIKRMGELGLMGIPISPEVSGAGMDFTSYVLAIHELSKESAALGVILTVHTELGTKRIVAYGKSKHIQIYVPKHTTGRYLGGFALSEPIAGSDAASLKTTAVNKGDYYNLTGSKVLITNDSEADTFITFAETN